MRSNPQLRKGNSVLPVLDLPPPFRLVTLREVGDAFLQARLKGYPRDSFTEEHLVPAHVLNLFERAVWSV